MVGPDHEMCAGCIWERMVKPLVSPLLGWERGHPVGEAKDPEPYSFAAHVLDWDEFWSKQDDRSPATTETEKWLRTSDAWDAFTGVLLVRLNDADPANGHGIGWVDKAVTRRWLIPNCG